MSERQLRDEQNLHHKILQFQIGAKIKTRDITKRESHTARPAK